MNQRKFDFFSPWQGVRIFILMVIGTVGILIYLGIISPIQNYLSINEKTKYNCFKYVNYEHKDYVLFENFEGLKKFKNEYPKACTEDFVIQENSELIIKNETITVELLEVIDSQYVKVEYREFILKKEYFTLKCFLDKYSPEDFTF